MNDYAICNFFQKSESSKYRKKGFGYPDPYPVPFDSRFWISVSGCKLTILPDIQPANRIVIISDSQPKFWGAKCLIFATNTFVWDAASQSTE